MTDIEILQFFAQMFGGGLLVGLVWTLFFNFSGI